MKRIALLAAVTAAFLFLGACGREQTQQSTVRDPNTGAMLQPNNDYWAKDNFDLQRVGDLVVRSRSPEEFERYLNRPRGINNLDLNGDGYVDYISVREFNDLNDPYSRGLSMYTQYGPDLIQELGTVYFYRDDPGYPGARILLRGDPRIYGDNYYYETNWLDRSLQLVSYLFNGNRDVYSTPYYYDNYPTWYETYEVVETPVYQTRVVELYPQPVVVYTTTPAIVDKIQIKSPNDGMHFDQIKAQLVKPAKAQEDFIKNNPRMVQVAKNGKAAKPVEEKPGKAESQPNIEKPGGQPEAKQPKPEAPKAAPPKIARAERPNAKPAPMRPVTRPSKPNNPAPAKPANRAPGNPPKMAPGKPAKPQGNPGKGQGKPGNPGGGNKGGGKGKKG